MLTMPRPISFNEVQNPNLVGKGGDLRVSDEVRFCCGPYPC